MQDAMSIRQINSGACSRHSVPTSQNKLCSLRSPSRSRNAQPVRAIAEAPARPQSQNGAKPQQSEAPQDWAPDSWKKFQAWQQPNYPDRVSWLHLLRVFARDLLVICIASARLAIEGMILYRIEHLRVLRPLTHADLVTAQVRAFANFAQTRVGPYELHQRKL